MKQNIHTRRNRLTAYLAAGVGAGAAVQQSEGVTIVTSYGPGAQNPSTTPATPVGINIAMLGSHERGAGVGGGYDATFALGPGTGYYFTRGTDFSPLNGGPSGRYFAITGLNDFVRGAVAGDQNYASISFNGDDDVYEAVAQFSFDGLGNGYLVAVAENDDFSALSISDGVAAIAGGGASVPEHGSSIALLAMGAAGLLVLRRKMAS